MPSSVLVVSILFPSEVARKHAADPRPQCPRQRHDCRPQPGLLCVVDGLGECKGWGDEYDRADGHPSQYRTYPAGGSLPYHAPKYDVGDTSDASDTPE